MPIPAGVDEIRNKVLSSFEVVNFHYSHTLPRAYNSGFIDGMAWVGIMSGAAHKVGDTGLANSCDKFLLNLLLVGDDARNYAPLQARADWIASTSEPGFWYIVKPQAFAGPAALKFAVDNGAVIAIPAKLDIKSTAKWIASSGFFFGLLARTSGSLRGYANSVWTAHLILGKKPSSTMLWMCEENPYFSYIAGKKCRVEYPPSRRFLNGQTSAEKSIVPLKDAEPSAWIFRRDPFNKYNGTPPLVNEEYTPIAQLAATYLQSTL